MVDQRGVILNSSSWIAIGKDDHSCGAVGFDKLKNLLHRKRDAIKEIRSVASLKTSDASFDHVLSWNVIYHGDETVVAGSIAEIARVLKPGGTFMGTMLSARRVPVELAKASGREISRNTWVFDGPGDKVHPHYFCPARDLVALFAVFELSSLVDREHDTPGSWHWHVLAERVA